MKHNFFFLILSLCFFVLHVSAQVSLSPLFSDGMVLQQRSSVKIWGKASPHKKVTVAPSWGKAKYSTVVQADSSWSVKVQTPEGSFQRFSISVKSGATLVLNNVAVGEVWLAGGQSNMEMQMNGTWMHQPVQNAAGDIAHSTNEYIRMIQIKKVSRARPLSSLSGVWKEANPNNTGEFSAVAYYFARLIHRVCGVPVGIINCNWGGSTIEAWMSDEAIAAFPEKMIVKHDSEIVASKANQTPTALYKGMLHPIVGYGMKGMIWYQGESNKDNYKEYPALFAAMHSDWMQRWGIGEFPVFICQIAPFQYGGGVNSAFIREAQMKIADTQPLTGVAVLMDCGERHSIHPANKRTPGERLAYLAINKAYGMTSFNCEAPRYDSYSVKDSTILVKMKGVKRGFTTYSRSSQCFKIAGEDRVFHPARARFRGADVIEVYAPEVKEPMAVRYAFEDFVVGDLFSSDGLPVSSFRTDDWEP